MIDINKNNLEYSASPYLRQHADNPVNWQEWKEEILKKAMDRLENFVNKSRSEKLES
ncbi:MAG TPA: DUF255 domain-containing protein [Tepiditoga sp.]|nr:DUF255 domain-containing protein [Tepiditoga sp.]